jgi:DNA-binding NarL/FixJ family response regulator
MTGEEKMLRVCVFGDGPLERAGVRRVLEEDERIRVVGEGPVGRFARLVRASRPDLLVSLHDDPDDTLGTLPSSGPPLPRIVLVSHLSEQSARMLLHQGANGILLREDSVAHLHWAVRAAAAGGLALDPTAAALVAARLIRPERLTEATVTARRLVATLSPREQEILRFLEQGAANVEMAEALNISGHTVKDHIRAVYTKLAVDNRVQAARIAWQAQDVRAVGADAVARARTRAGVWSGPLRTVTGGGTGFRPSGAPVPHPH